MTATLLAFCGGTGAYFLYTSLVLGHKQISFSHRQKNNSSRLLDEWITQAGLADVDHKQLFSVVVALFVSCGVLGWLLFGGTIAPLIVATFGATFPIAAYKQRRAKRRAKTAEAWPRLIEEIRLLCGSLGRPIPQALLEVGKAGPVELRPAFLAAEREWRMSTDFLRSISVLKEQLADPTADVTCETLLIAHAVGGSDVDRRLAALAKDRLADLHSRKDAQAKQAGVRFARRFVLIVPIGMALAGMAIGDGRAAYAAPTGQFGVAFGLIMLVACWFWSGRLIRLPHEERVFRD